MSEPLLQVIEVSRSFAGKGGDVQAIGSVSFAVEPGEFVSVVGPSGCGKTTLLKCISGLLTPSSGRTLLRDEPVTSPPREMALVFQDYVRSLLPWLTVRNNVLLPVRKRRDIADKNRVVMDALDAVGLSGFADHYPWQLSGGMQQRTAIARALAYQPKVLLMDEPFASVDAQTRADLEDLVLEVRRTFDMTVVLVTHDIDESIYMSDRVVVLSSRPSTVKEVLDVDLPVPRNQIKTKELPGFACLRTEVYLAIRGQQPTTGAPMASHPDARGLEVTTWRGA